MPIENQRQRTEEPRILVVMGVAGCGKSTVGDALAKQLGKPFLDADDYHPVANVEKMSRGIALTDADRWPWLDILGAALRQQAEQAKRVVSACSALRRSYRDRLLAAAGEPICFVFLRGERALIASRMSARTNHFMPTELLESQFATLEPPAADERSLTVDIGPPNSVLVEEICTRLDADSEMRTATRTAKDT